MTTFFQQTHPDETIRSLADHNRASKIAMTRQLGGDLPSEECFCPHKGGHRYPVLKCLWLHGRYVPRNPYPDTPMGRLLEVADPLPEVRVPAPLPPKRAYKIPDKAYNRWSIWQVGDGCPCRVLGSDPHGSGGKCFVSSTKGSRASSHCKRHQKHVDKYGAWHLGQIDDPAPEFWGELVPGQHTPYIPKGAIRKCGPRIPWVRGSGVEDDENNFGEGW